MPGGVEVREWRVARSVGVGTLVIAEEGAAAGVVSTVGNDGMMGGSRRGGGEWVRINHQDTKATSVGLSDILSLSSIPLSRPAITFTTYQVIFLTMSTAHGHE